MAEKIVSPGVFQREADQSFIAPAPIEAGAAIIGPTVKGPELQPTLVTSFSDYKDKFGTIFYSGSNKYEFLTSIAVQRYFANGGTSMLVTRVVSGSVESATSTRILANSGSATGTFSVASVNFTGNIPDGFEGFRVSDSTGQTFLIAYSSSVNLYAGGTGDTHFIQYTDLSNATSIINASSSLIGLTAALNSNVLSLSSSVVGAGFNGHTIQTGSVATTTGNMLTSVVGLGGLSILSTFAGGAATTSTANTNANISFTLKTIGKGTKLNNTPDADPNNILQYSDGSLKSGSADNLRWEVSGINNKAGTFNLELRRGDDNNLTPVVLETYLNLSLDPNSENYIERRVGNQYISIENYDGQRLVRVNGEYPNRSRFVYVSSVNKITPFYLNNDGSIGSEGGLSYSASLPFPTSGAFHSGVGDILPTGEAGKYFENISAANVGNIQGLTGDDYTIAVNLLKNKDEYRFTTIATPGIYNQDYASVVNSVVELCEERGDCFYIADLVKYNSTITEVTDEANELNTSFAGAYWPWVQVASTELSKNVWVPTSAVMQGVYALNDRVAAPWFAPAGLNRGGLLVSRAEIKLPQNLRDTLYSNKVNPIATFPRNGVVAFGQKTLQTRASALDRINVRRLLISLKNFIGDTARNLVFEQNTIVTRNKFLNAVNPFLESVQQRQGLYAFKITMDETNNTSDAIDRNQLVGQILLQPTKTAEFIILDYTIQPTGATFGE